VKGYLVMRQGSRRYRALRSALNPVLLAGAVALVACGVSSHPLVSQQVPGGDADRGKQAMRRYGCGSCHGITGIADARGDVGPPLNGMGHRRIIAGVLANEPANLMHWLQDPQSVVPGNAMPNMGISDAEARDMAAYLYTLK
jgi:cytochrome c